MNNNNIQFINVTNINCPNLVLAYQDVKTKNIGEEDVSHFRFFDIEHVLKRQNVEDMITKIIQMVHFDEDYPENQNIFITEKNNNPTCMVRVDGMWKMNEPLSNVTPMLLKSINNFAQLGHIGRREEYLGRYLYITLLDLERASEPRNIKPNMYGINNTIYSMTKTMVPDLIKKRQEKEKKRLKQTAELEQLLHKK